MRMSWMTKRSRNDPDSPKRAHCGHREVLATAVLKPVCWLSIQSVVLPLPLECRHLSESAVLKPVCWLSIQSVVLPLPLECRHLSESVVPSRIPPRGGRGLSLSRSGGLPGPREKNAI